MMSNNTAKKQTSKNSHQKSEDENMSPLAITPAVDGASLSDVKKSPGVGEVVHETITKKQLIVASSPTKPSPGTTGAASPRAAKVRKKKSSDYRNAKRLLRQLPLSMLLQVGRWIPDRIARLAHPAENTVMPAEKEKSTALATVENPITDAK